MSNLLPYTSDMTDQILYRRSTGRWTPAARLERRPDISVGRMDQRTEYLRPLALDLSIQLTWRILAPPI